ncbi:MAG TPA: PTS sugar transporter subunit IIB [Gemmatimonadales bacterium]|jgi:PTS system mannose-specific IIB component/fructoselysine and glucoselysine-specific PTS system IIB component|nr:PTS sugar transporter subunit IIB [Gemmatimonadales bacterium]
MPIALSRVDDRLVHGQVVIGWGRSLGIALIVLVDEGVAASAWEQDLYRMAVPAGVELRFATVAEAAARLDEWQASPVRTMLLTGDVETMVALHRSAPAIVHRINLGGIHHRPGRRERLPYVYLTDDELHALEAVQTSGAQVTAQDLPTTAPVALKALA